MHNNRNNIQLCVSNIATHKVVVLQRLYDGVFTVIVLCTLAYTGLFAESKRVNDTVILKNGTALTGEKTVVTKDSLAVKSITSQTGIELILIPAGEFMMGCSVGDRECGSDEKPAHKVKITKSFYMGKYEVTQGQWKAVMGNNPSSFSSCGENCPVELVSWKDIIQFLNKLSTKEGKKPAYQLETRWFSKDEYVRLESANGYRLPTEAEWEYAARGGTTTKYYVNNLSSIAWYDLNSRDTSHPVGQNTPNAFGLYDMLGNVWEWTGDWYADNLCFASETTDPVGSSFGTYRVYRGGSWYDWAVFGRSSYRGINSPDRRYGNLGFRVVILP